MIYGQTVIHPLALTATIIAGILMLLLPRKHAIVPLLAAAIFIPTQQQIVVFSLDFVMLRILVLFGWLRIFLRAEYRALQLNAIDKTMILLAVARLVSYTILWQTPEALINRLGVCFDAVGIYFLIRFWVRDFNDVIYAFKALVVICLPLAVAMLMERVTGRNIFAIFGGVPELTEVRDGRLRCQGAFAHPILAGAFGAALLPIALGLWHHNKKLALAGGLAATIVAVSTSSSGPALAYISGLSAFCLWPFRRLIGVMRWGLACALLALQIVMNRPIWAMFTQVKVFGASTAYQRYFLFDQFISRFSEWWLFGTKSTGHWGYFLFDVTNQYIRIAVDGGLMTLSFFLAGIIFCYRYLGRALQASEDHPPRQIFLWALGASLFSHLASFMGVSYFDQIIVIWYMLLAAIAAVGSLLDKPSNGNSTFMSSPSRAAQHECCVT